MDQTTIRKAEAADFPAVAACVDAAYSTYVARIGRKPAPMLADYQSLIGDGLVWVATAGRNLLGVLVLVPGSDHLLIENVAVHPEHQGRGLGRRLMAFAKDRASAAGCDELRLYTNEAMTENVAIYLRLGYEEVERREEHSYRRVFMRKVLRPGADLNLT